MVSLKVNVKDPEKKKKKEEVGAFVRSGTNKASGITLPSGETFLGLSPADVAKVQKHQGLESIPQVGQAEREAMATEERRKAFQAETGSEEKIAGLQKQAEDMPSMAPKSLLGESKEEVIEEQTATQALFKIAKDKAEEVIIAPGIKGKVPLGAKVSAAALAGGILAYPWLSSFVAKGVVTKSILGTAGSIPGLKTAVAGLSIFLLGKTGIFEINGDEMETYRGRLQKVVEDGERLEATIRNGDPETAVWSMGILTDMMVGVDEAEARIQELGYYNLKYRVSKEWLLDMEKVRSARMAIVRRMMAAENIAATGTAATNPEALMFHASQFD